MDGEGNPIYFSRRQLEVLEKLKQGKQNKIIAHELNMCESTVKVHIRHLMRKLERIPVTLHSQHERRSWHRP